MELGEAFKRNTRLRLANISNSKIPVSSEPETFTILRFAQRSLPLVEIGHGNRVNARIVVTYSDDV
jgi:hypothetical protein